MKQELDVIVFSMKALLMDEGGNVDVKNIPNSNFVDLDLAIAYAQKVKKRWADNSKTKNYKCKILIYTDQCELVDTV